MLFYLNRNRRAFSFTDTGRIKEHFEEKRRFHYRYILEFSNHVLFLFMLAVGVRIGSLLFFIFSDFTEPHLAYALENINLPGAESSELIINKRIHTLLTVYPDGGVKIDGIEVSRDVLQKELILKKQDLPMVIIDIIADKDCEMQVILKVMEICKKAGTTRVLFMTTRNVGKADLLHRLVKDS